MFKNIGRPPPVHNVPDIISRGSPIRRYAVPGINASAVTDPINVTDKYPEMKTWAPFDSLIIQNNSAQPLEVYLNGDVNDLYPIPAYMIQPIQRRWYNFITIKNVGALATNAGDIQLQFRRLPPDVTPTVAVQ